MSFLNTDNSESLSARITQKGRNSIANGNFNIEYFQIGDSEFDYTSPFNQLTGGTTNGQKVMSPFDKDSGIKYPYKIDSSTTSTTYGVPVLNSSTETIRNVMGPAGFVTEYNEFDVTESTGSTIECEVQTISITALNATTSITVTDGTAFQECNYVTIVFDELGANSTITDNNNSLVYKITGITGNVLYLDRKTPDLSTLTGNIQVICNKCEIEYPVAAAVSPSCLPNPTNPLSQQNPWTLNVVWGQKPIGADVNGTDESLKGYESNMFVSTKELLGYTSTGQTFTNVTGGSISYPTSFLNSYDEQVEVTTEEQRCIAIIHYSELGDLVNDPERFYKYDDYISYKTGITGSDISLVDDRDGNPISDTEYFEVYIPFIYYHRNTGTTYGAVFTMDTVDYYVKSTKNATHQLLFRYLIDEQGVKVGKVFPKNKIVVFDDQELVAILDYRSNRRYTLGAPKVGLTPSDNTAANSLLTGTTGQTLWITYMFSDTLTGSSLNSLPSNYFVKVDGTTTPSSATVKFSGTTFQYLNSTLNGFKTGFVAKKFFILAQLTNYGDIPTPDSWRIIEYTTEAGGNGTSFLNKNNLTGVTFTVTYSNYNSASLFDLETYLSNTDYLLSEPSSNPQFGDEQTFPGSIRLVRASDIEQLNFLVNLPSTQFTETQNPTYISGDKRVTEVALLNSNKETLVVAKTSSPVKRTGTQVFSVKLDF